MGSLEPGNNPDQNLKSVKQLDRQILEICKEFAEIEKSSASGFSDLSLRIDKALKQANSTYDPVDERCLVLHALKHDLAQFCIRTQVQSLDFKSPGVKEQVLQKQEESRSAYERFKKECYSNYSNSLFATGLECRRQLLFLGSNSEQAWACSKDALKLLVSSSYWKLDEANPVRYLADMEVHNAAKYLLDSPTHVLSSKKNNSRVLKNYQDLIEGVRDSLAVVGSNSYQEIILKQIDNISFQSKALRAKNDHLNLYRAMQMTDLLYEEIEGKSPSVLSNLNSLVLTGIGIGDLFVANHYASKLLASLQEVSSNLEGFLTVEGVVTLRNSCSSLKAILQENANRKDLDDNAHIDEVKCVESGLINILDQATTGLENSPLKLEVELFKIIGKVRLVNDLIVENQRPESSLKIAISQSLANLTNEPLWAHVGDSPASEINTQELENRIYVVTSLGEELRSMGHANIATSLIQEFSLSQCGKHLVERDLRLAASGSERGFLSSYAQWALEAEEADSIVNLYNYYSDRVAETSVPELTKRHVYSIMGRILIECDSQDDALEYGKLVIESAFKDIQNRKPQKGISLARYDLDTAYSLLELAEQAYEFGLSKKSESLFKKCLARAMNASDGEERVAQGILALTESVRPAHLNWNTFASQLENAPKKVSEDQIKPEGLLLISLLSNALYSKSHFSQSGHKENLLSALKLQRFVDYRETKLSAMILRSLIVINREQESDHEVETNLKELYKFARQLGVEGDFSFEAFYYDQLARLELKRNNFEKAVFNFTASIKTYSMVADSEEFLADVRTRRAIANKWLLSEVETLPYKYENSMAEKIKISVVDDLDQAIALYEKLDVATKWRKTCLKEYLQCLSEWESELDMEPAYSYEFLSSRQKWVESQIKEAR